MSSSRNTREPKEDNVTLGPTVREGKLVFGVVHVFYSFNDTVVHATDLSGRETLVRVTGKSHDLYYIERMKGKDDRYANTLAAQDVAQRCKKLGITAIHVKLRLRATGGIKTKNPAPGVQSAFRALARSGLKIGRREDVTLIPTNSTRRKSGRSGRRQ